MARALAVSTVAAGTAGFGVAIAARDAIDPWWSSAAIAAVTGASALWLLRARLRALLGWRFGGAAIAAGLGLVMVALTHAGFRIAAAVSPEMAEHVAGLYAGVSDAPPLPLTIALIAAVVVAEELLWRGLAIDLLERRLAGARLVLGAVALYAVPQLIGGSPILVLAAIAIGVVTALERLATGRLTEPVITHAIWSVSIFALVPVI